MLHKILFFENVSRNSFVNQIMNNFIKLKQLPNVLNCPKALKAEN